MQIFIRYSLQHLFFLFYSLTNLNYLCEILLVSEIITTFVAINLLYVPHNTWFGENSG
jgi:hypothetical protein